MFHRIIESCADKPLYRDPVYQENPDPNIPYDQHVERSYLAQRYANSCIVDKLASDYLPRERALYFLYGRPYLTGYPNHAMRPLLEHFPTNGLSVLDPTEYLEQHISDSVWNRPRFFVSERDRHPSRQANDLFAEFLFERISTEPKWGFSAASWIGWLEDRSK